MLKHFLCVVLFLTVFQDPQVRNSEGRLAGFLKSPTEHLIDDIQEPFTVRSIEGTVVIEGTQMPLTGAIVEIRGPDASTRIVSQSVDKRGRFRFRRQKQGSYTFKVTLNYYQSVVGTVVVSKEASPNVKMNIQMKVGV